VLLVLSISAAARLYQVTLPVMWGDEAFSIALSRLSPEQVVFHTARDVHPPLYYLVLHFWMQWVGDGTLAIRSLSVWSGVATVGIGMWLTRLLSSWRAALMAGLLLALLPLAVRYSQEVRMYAMLDCLLLMAACMLWLWVRTRQSGYLYCYALLMLSALYTHYFSIFCLLASWVYLLIAHCRKDNDHIKSRAWWLCNVAISFAFLPWLPVLYRQLQHRHLIVWIGDYDPSSFMTLPRSVWNLFTFSNDQPSVNWLYSDIHALLATAVLAAAALLLVRKGAKSDAPAVLLLSYCLVPVVLVWLLSFAFPLYMDRYVLFALLGFPIVLAIALDDMPGKMRVLALTVCLTVEVLGLGTFYKIHSREDADASGLDVVMAEVAKKRQVDDAVLVGGWRYFSAGYYNPTDRELLLQTLDKADTSGIEEHTYGAMTLLYQRSDQLYVADPLSLAQRYRRVWWISDLDVSPLERKLNESWTRVMEIRQGRIKALLFTVPEKSKPYSTEHDQVVSGSKLSARAICHIRE